MGSPATPTRDSTSSGFVEAVQDDPDTYERVGWVSSNAHPVETVFSNVQVLETASRTFLAGEDGFRMLLYVVPIALLLAAGLAIARYLGTPSASDGAVAVIAVVPGYFLARVVGTLLFGVSVGEATGAPDAPTALVLAGIGYLAVVAGSAAPRGTSSRPNRPVPARRGTSPSGR